MVELQWSLVTDSTTLTLLHWFISSTPAHPFGILFTLLYTAMYFEMGITKLCGSGLPPACVSNEAKQVSSKLVVSVAECNSPFCHLTLFYYQALHVCIPMYTRIQCIQYHQFVRIRPVLLLLYCVSHCSPPHSTHLSVNIIV